MIAVIVPVVIVSNAVYTLRWAKGKIDVLHSSIKFYMM